MNRPSQIALIAIIMATGAAWAQGPASSGLSRAAQQEEGSQLLPEARPPFSPASGNPRAAPTNAGHADDKSAPRSSVGIERVGSGSDSPVPSAQCDLRLCASTYRSFRASDCTYQPYTGGPRQLCER